MKIGESWKSLHFVRDTKKRISSKFYLQWNVNLLVSIFKYEESLIASYEILFYCNNNYYKKI